MFNVILLGVVSFLNDISTELIAPILPMFIVGLGASSVSLGLIGGLMESISAILKVFSGLWADRVGKNKIFVSTGYLTSSVFKMLLAFSKIWSSALIFLSFERMGKGIRTAPRDAIISESISGHSGKGFGIHRALDTSGAILGALLCFILVVSMTFKQIILLAAGIGFVALIPLLWVKEKHREPQRITLKIGLKELPKKARAFILIASIFALGNFSYMFFILKVCEKFDIRMPILLYVLFNIFYAIGAIPFGILADKLGKKRVIGLGYILFFITCAGFSVAHALSAFIILFAVYGLVYAIIDGNQRAFISELTPTNLRATALGTFHTAIGVSALPASLIAGGLWKINSTLTFGFGGIMAFIAAIWILTTGEP